LPGVSSAGVEKLEKAVPGLSEVER
jgi:hypothetical protein